MSALTLNTILLFMALAPGFVALTAFYALGRLPRRAYGSSVTIELGTMTTVALFAHLIFGGVYAVCVAPLIFEPGVIGGLVDLLLNQVAGRVPPPAVTASGERIVAGAEFYAVAGYILFVCTAAALAGFLLVRAIETGFWIFWNLAETMTGGLFWRAFVRPEGRMGPIFVYVLTNIVHDGRFLMYSGVLENISRQGPAWIEYLVLSSASRLLMTIDQDNATTSCGGRHAFGLDDDGAMHSRLVVPAAIIANVVFRPIPVLVGEGRPRVSLLRRLFAGSGEPRRR